jgi:hypothetical protein
MKASRKITLDIPSALTLPPYFRNFDWAEAEADADIAAGRVKCFSSVEEAVANLKA